MDIVFSRSELEVAFLLECAGISDSESLLLLLKGQHRPTSSYAGCLTGEDLPTSLQYIVR